MDNVPDPRREIAGQQTGFHALRSSGLAPRQCQQDGTSADKITQHSQRHFTMTIISFPLTGIDDAGSLREVSCLNPALYQT
jgi:hypothetical protein